MKKRIALFLAFVLALSLPLIFATNEFDAPEHDHDGECGLCGAGGDSPMWFRGYCPTCDLIATLEYDTYPDRYVDDGDDGHWAYTYGDIYCTECGSILERDAFIGEAFEDHSYDIIIDYDSGVNMYLYECGLCQHQKWDY